MIARSLAVRLNAVVIGTLSQERGRLRFQYGEQAVVRHGLGRPVLSISLPTGLRRFSDAECRPFFDGLLPEGEARRIIAYGLDLPEADTFGLLASIGRECAGAVAVLNPSDPPEDPPLVARARPLSAADLDQLIRDLRLRPLGIDGDVRVSLTGWQEKLLVTDLGGGRWGLPILGSASTHIIKPANPLLPDLVVGEALCLRAAALAGVGAASVALAELGGRGAIIVERFDRTVGTDGVIERRHQEDMCQATATQAGSGGRKYEEHGGPSLARIAAILDRWGRPEDRVELLRQVTCNVVFGNADAHAMNTSIVLPSEGRVQLAPLYDVAPTLLAPGVSTTAGMFINGVRDLAAVTLHDVVAEGVAWGLSSDLATTTVNELAMRLPDAVAHAGAGLPIEGPRFDAFVAFTRRPL